MHTILIVDDEQQILEGLRSTLSWADLQIGPVITAQSFEEAVDRAIEYEPALALIDVCLGERRGYELIRHLRGLGHQTHYLMMSGYEEFEYVRQSMQSGARGYLLKPIQRKELEAALLSIIDEAWGGLPDGASDARHVDPVLARPYDDLSKLTRKMVLMVQAEYGDSMTLRHVADLFRMNSTYLGQIFLRDTGIKFSEYLGRFRLLEAKRLIEETDEKISAIARQVGFGNMGYFYTQFRELFAMSPSDLRERRGDAEGAS